MVKKVVKKVQRKMSSNSSSNVITNKFNYLSSIINLHINHQEILAQKTGFLVAVSALILTIVLSVLFNSVVEEIPILIKGGLILLALGSAFSIIVTISVEKILPVKRVKSFHPLSLEEFHDEAKQLFYKDLVKTCSSNKFMFEDFSNQILEMKEDIFKKTAKIALAINFLTVPLFIMTMLIVIQLFISII